MHPKDPIDRPDIVAAIRGGDHSLGMEGEADPGNATHEQAVFWKAVYEEIVAVEEAVLDRIHQLMAGRSDEARQEIELTNIPVVVAQVARFRARLGYWTARVDSLS